jgi:hypothetical protein
VRCSTTVRHSEPTWSARVKFAQTKVRHLIAAVEAGTSSLAILAAINAREAELRAMDATVSALDEPIEHRMTVIPTWVRTQLHDAAGLIGESPERARAEFLRLGINFTLHPVLDNGTPFLRAVGSGQFEHLAFNETLLTSGRSSPRSTRRTALRLRGSPPGGPPHGGTRSGHLRNRDRRARHFPRRRAHSVEARPGDRCGQLQQFARLFWGHAVDRPPRHERGNQPGADPDWHLGGGEC